MRFVTIGGLIAKARRFLNSSASVHDDDVTEPKKLGEILRNIIRRVSDLESRVAPEAVEFEVAVSTAGALVSLNHGLSAPVRWWVTVWTRPVAAGAYPTTAPILVQDASTTPDILVLKSYTAGRAVVRVEPAVGVMEP